MPRVTALILAGISTCLAIAAGIYTAGRFEKQPRILSFLYLTFETFRDFPFYRTRDKLENRSAEFKFKIGALSSANTQFPPLPIKISSAIVDKMKMVQKKKLN